MTVDVFKIPQLSPDDVSGLDTLIQQGKLDPQSIVAILGKTEGNGCVNDFTRGFATQSLKFYLHRHLSAEDVNAIVYVMSGGTEGVLSPHITVFCRTEPSQQPIGFGLALGINHTRPFAPEEIGSLAMVSVVAKAVEESVQSARIRPQDVHFVQIKCPLVTARDQEQHQMSSYQSMALSRGASALGVAVALGEVNLESIQHESIGSAHHLYSSVASTSAGVELQNCEILTLGNSHQSASNYVIGHSVMKHALDAEAVYHAIESTGQSLANVVNVFAKAEANPSGFILGRRHTMLDDSDISHTRMARAVVGSVIASIVKDPMIYVSGGSEHQGPPGGGPVAVIARQDSI